MQMHIHTHLNADLTDSDGMGLLYMETSYTESRLPINELQNKFTAVQDDSQSGQWLSVVPNPIIVPSHTDKSVLSDNMEQVQKKAGNWPSWGTSLVWFPQMFPVDRTVLWHSVCI